VKLELMDFAYSYITRSGRIDNARLRAMSPAFMADMNLRNWPGALLSNRIANPVPLDSPGAPRQD
jgi:hypothetical protein